METTDNMDHFTLILSTNRLMESMLVMATLLNWPLLDLGFLPILDSHNGGKRYGKKDLVPTPHPDELPQRVIDAIKAHSKLDQQLYQRAEDLLDEKIEICREVNYIHLFILKTI